MHRRLFALGKIFPTEKPFNFGSIDVEFIRSSVVCQVLKGRCMTVGHVDSQSAASFFDELSSAYQFLYPEHNLSLVHHLFDVSKLAIERRCTVAEDAQLHMPPDSQEFEVLAPLLSHLSLLVKLQSLTDEVSGDSLDSEIIDAFANSHSSGYIEALKTAVSMAVSPSLVIQTYARLLEHLSESFPALEDIYAAILRQKMADGSIDDLERIIRSVVECVVMNDGQLDEDGWGMDVLEENVSELQTAIDLIETKMKKELLDFTSATGSFDVHVVDYVKGLLNNVSLFPSSSVSVSHGSQYFALENSEFSIVENPSGSKSYGLWDIDVGVSSSLFFPHMLIWNLRKMSLQHWITGRLSRLWYRSLKIRNKFAILSRFHCKMLKMDSPLRMCHYYAIKSQNCGNLTYCCLIASVFQAKLSSTAR